MRIPFGQTPLALLMVMGVGGKALAAPAAPADPLAPVITTTPTTVRAVLPMLDTVVTCSREAFKGSLQAPDGDTESWGITQKGSKAELIITRAQDGLQIIVDWKSSASQFNPYTVVLPLAGQYTTRTVVTPADADKQVPAIVKGLDPLPMASILEDISDQLRQVEDYIDSCKMITKDSRVPTSVFLAPHQQVVAPNRVTIPPSLFPSMG